jgi:thymidine phosphorylase
MSHKLAAKVQEWVMDVAIGKPGSGDEGAVR